MPRREELDWRASYAVVTAAPDVVERALYVGGHGEESNWFIERSKDDPLEAISDLEAIADLIAGIGFQGCNSSFLSALAKILKRSPAWKK